MKHIAKHTSPQEFEDWKTWKKPIQWEDLPSSRARDEDLPEGAVNYSKRDLRQTLLEEHGYICAYCQERIENNPLQTKIEHLKAKEEGKYPHLTFDYNNLLVCCSGGDTDPKPRFPHCDSARSPKNEDLPLDPLMQNCEQDIGYTKDGGIYGNTDYAAQTIRLLGLDIAKLKNKRKGAIQGALQGTELFTPEDFLNLRIAFNSRDVTGMFVPFCQVIRSVI